MQKKNENSKAKENEKEITRYVHSKYAKKSRIKFSLQFRRNLRWQCSALRLDLRRGPKRGQDRRRQSTRPIREEIGEYRQHK